MCLKTAKNENFEKNFKFFMFFSLFIKSKAVFVRLYFERKNKGGFFMGISELVEQIKKGNNTAFEELYKLTEREIWFTCISF